MRLGGQSTQRRLDRVASWHYVNVDRSRPWLAGTGV